MIEIEAKGSHYDIGLQIGEQCKEIASQLCEQFRTTWSRKKINRQDAILNSLKFLPYARSFYNEYFLELSGYADAIGLQFEEVFAWFCDDPLVPKGCTDFVLSPRVTDPDHTYMVHNEDYDVQEEDYAVLARIHPDGEPSFMAMSYGGIWFNAGVNSEGIGVAGPGLSYTDARVGIPADFSFRKIFSATRIAEAMEFSTPTERAGSYCNIIADSSGEMYAMEASATDFVAIHAKDYLVHSNHYLSPRMEKYDAAFRQRTDRSPGFYSDSIVRYNRVKNLIEDWIGVMPDLTILRIQEILQDHVNHPWSVCRHPDMTQPEAERSKTLFSQIIDLNERSMLICQGNPCEGEYVEYTLTTT